MVSGLSGSAKSFFLHGMTLKSKGKLLCLVPSEEQAHDLSREMRGFMGKGDVHLFLAHDFLFAGERSASTYPGFNRIVTLNELANSRRGGIVIATAGSLLFKITSRRVFKEQSLRLSVHQEIDLDHTLRRLVSMGYERCQVVTEPGHFSVRGGILDIFPVGSTKPFRVELFGDEIESMRRFDPDTQRSAQKVGSFTVTLADELAPVNAETHFLDYVEPDVTIFVDEPGEVAKSLERQARRYREFLDAARQKEQPVKTPAMVSWEETESLIRKHPVVYHSFFPRRLDNISLGFYEHISQKEMEPFFAYPELVNRRLKEWLENGYAVTFAVRDQKTETKVKEELELSQMTGVAFARWDIEKGFISPTLRVALISDRDLWGRRYSRTARRKKAREKDRLGIEQLKVGDYVVHENHGIGLFQGITRMDVEGVKKEYLVIQYAGTDRLYLPVDKVEMLSRYSGPDEKQPRLNKLGGSDWEKTKNRVKESVREMAEELLRLYAIRQSVPGTAYSPDTVWQKEFEEAFEYEETPDQARAVADVKRDMERPRPMDRLICGDVGYGKTEVALRAAFKAVMDHKQVAILVPTTILAEQHYRTCLERFGDIPVVIEVLSRFRSPSQQKKILDDLSRGVVDIIIGTHRLLSKDVCFKDLGLLVVDEEHRFGVKQKEKIKALRETVDVLSLSATPIPRTLHMALTGLRDLSVIETPPPDRYPITTYVLEYNGDIIREAVMAEVDRGGQVFVVHNRIQDIDIFRSELEVLLPNIKMEVAHGRMPEDRLADVMRRFIDKEFQVLVCTTIIESGLDIPNVNTLIVDEADRLGLAQLYQLRGRVGRSRRLAYAYFTYRRDKAITEAAQKRLNAIREFTELGSGMKIALRDLEIRGAGNILGPEQHGHIAAVGFDLYCRLLEEETACLKGQERPVESMPSLDIQVDTYIPDDYVGDSSVKIQVYRRAMLANSTEEIDNIRSELEDRFGKLPIPVENLLKVSRLRVTARKKNIKSINTNGRRLEIRLSKPMDGAIAHLRGLSREMNLPISPLDNRTITVNLDNVPTLNLLEQILEAI